MEPWSRYSEARGTAHRVYPPSDCEQVANLADRLEIPVAGVALEADITVPERARGVVLFAHGSGSSRHSPRNRYVAAELRRAGLATVLADLLTRDEERLDARTAKLRFDIDRLAVRTSALTDWISEQESTAGLGIGLFGASTGAAAALVAAAAPTEHGRCGGLARRPT